MRESFVQVNSNNCLMVEKDREMRTLATVGNEILTSFWWMCMVDFGEMCHCLSLPVLSICMLNNRIQLHLKKLLANLIFKGSRPYLQTIFTRSTFLKKDVQWKMHMPRQKNQK